jgi:single-stranded-DNA-specific exonuclease
LEEILLTNRHIVDVPSFFLPAAPDSLSLEEIGIDVEQMRLAKERIVEAVSQKQKILVFGDYDADGICATAILWEALHRLGADATPFIPHREKHGYGLTWAALEELKQHPLPSLIVTVDTGITALDAVREFNRLGVEVIVTDHHQPDTVLPPALAIVHSPQVCGSVVAWCLARELSLEAAQNSLDLAALATVSDLMPLLGVNRSIVYHGLTQFNTTARPGLRALIAVAGLEKKRIDAGTIGYVLAPRINAMGRLSHGLDALRLLCTPNKARAAQLAALVDTTNADRQQLTEDLMQLARSQIHGQRKESILIAHSPEFHEGVIGLIAGKLVEWYAKPVIVISTRGDVSKASARSVPGVNITELIRTAKEHLLEAGGHPMAAGFGFEPNKLDAVMNHLYAYAREHIDPGLLQKTLEIECALPLELATEETVKTLQKFAPFGQKNPLPLFAFQNVRIAAVQTVGSDHQHLKLTVESENGRIRLPALAWGKGEAAAQLSAGAVVHLAGMMEVNEWRDRKTLQIILKDIQMNEDSQPVA